MIFAIIGKGLLTLMVISWAAGKEPDTFALSLLAGYFFYVTVEAMFDYKKKGRGRRT